MTKILNVSPVFPGIHNTYTQIWFLRKEVDLISLSKKKITETDLNVGDLYSKNFLNKVFFIPSREEVK